MHPRLSLNTPDIPQTPPEQPLNAPPIPQKALTLSRKVDECKPLLTTPLRKCVCSGPLRIIIAHVRAPYASLFPHCNKCSNPPMSWKVDECKPLPAPLGPTMAHDWPAGTTSVSPRSTGRQGLELVHVRAQLEQLQDTFKS